jgi:hypothetical protein
LVILTNLSVRRNQCPKGAATDDKDYFRKTHVLYLSGIFYKINQNFGGYPFKSVKSIFTNFCKKFVIAAQAAIGLATPTNFRMLIS